MLIMLEKSDWLLVVGACSCAAGGLFGYCYRINNRFVKILQMVNEYDVGDDKLHSEIDSGGGSLSYVAVKGCVSADGKVIHSAQNTEEEGVVSKTKIREHKSEWNPTFYKWSDSKKTLSTQWKTEPFSLTSVRTKDTSEYPNLRIHVSDPTTAHTLSLTTTSDTFEPSTTSFGGHALDLIKGEYTKGYQTIEQMLLVSVERTVIGEIIRTTNGRLLLKPPNDKSLRYYIISGGVKDVVNDELMSVLAWKILSIVFYVVAGGVTTYWAYKRYQRWVERRKFSRLKHEMEVFNEGLEDDRVCSICLSNPRNVVFLPCGHVCACSSCSEKLNDCPVCRGVIKNKTAVFL